MDGVLVSVSFETKSEKRNRRLFVKGKRGKIFSLHFKGIGHPKLKFHPLTTHLNVDGASGDIF